MDQSAEHAKKESKWDLGSDYVRNLLQVVIIALACFSIFLGKWGYDAQVHKQQVDSTLEYIKRLQNDDFTSAVWRLHDFTTCFEKNEKQHLSYRFFDNVNSLEERAKSDALAAKWWEYVENDDKLDYCATGKTRARVELESDVNIVYSRLESLASCAVKRLCNLDFLIEDLNEKQCAALRYSQKRTLELTLFERTQENKSLIESFDWITVLSFTNYMLLGHRTSLQWDTQTGNFALVVRRMERYMNCASNYNTDEKKQNLRRVRRGA